MNLEKQKTPLGYGYVLEIKCERRKPLLYYRKHKENLNADNIFRDGNKIFGYRME
ncbi:MAG: hypothetical protein ACLTER_13110 [Ruminococcus sp.]